jgi:AraC-like DNA-binding protein
MNPEFLDRSVDHDKSVSVTRYHNKPLVNIWHYHEQLELVCIIESSGTRFIGDNIQKYEAGDIILIGKNLPHMWQEESPVDSTSSSDVVAIHLGSSFTKSDLLSLPEYSNIKRLLDLSAQGIAFHNAHYLLDKIGRLEKLEGFQQFILVTEILNDLGSSKDFKLLTSQGFVEKLNDQKKGRLQLVHDYVMNNFRKEIGLVSAANVANMNPSSFSRYFKQAYGNTFSEYVNEIRVGYACKLLLEDDISVTQTCFQSGFNNISNFNKQFKKLRNLSPKEYRNRFRS